MSSYISNNSWGQIFTNPANEISDGRKTLPGVFLGNAYVSGVLLLQVFYAGRPPSSCIVNYYWSLIESSSLPMHPAMYSSFSSMYAASKRYVNGQKWGFPHCFNSHARVLGILHFSRISHFVRAICDWNAEFMEFLWVGNVPSIRC